MKRYIKTTNQIPEIYDMILCDSKMRRQVITAATNSKDLSSGMSRVRSSNLWAYKMNIKKYGDKTGDLVIQFKNKNGGPGEIYLYVGVPVNLWQKFIVAPSKGHFFWKYIRNTYRYRHLTGNKRGVLPNAIN